MAAPGFGAALMWGELSNQLGDWRNRNVDKRRQEEEAARLAAQDARVGMLDQRAVDWRNQDLQHRTAQEEEDRRRFESDRITDANRWAAGQKNNAVERKDDLAAEERAFERQQALIRLQAAVRPRAQTGGGQAPAPVRDEGEASTRLYETAHDMALAGRSPQDIANFVARDDQPFKQFFRDPRQRFTIVNQAAQDAANARAKAAPTVKPVADPAAAVDRLRRLSEIGSPQADLAFKSTFQKVMDPSGVIRDEDLQRMDGTGSIGQRFRGFVNRAQGKGALVEDQKENFISAAEAMSGAAPAGGGISPAEAAQLRAMGYTDAEIRAAGGR